ncbi:hypothetical protein [Embleya sp. NPDC020630]|uniref:hypothetical protein n=1 Tax=Embleya sp. NPDC020630 TaxID=3363979 RepID=UPI0037AFD967
MVPSSAGSPAPASVRIASRLPPTRTPTAVPPKVIGAVTSVGSRCRVTGVVVVSAVAEAGPHRFAGGWTGGGDDAYPIAGV